MCICSNMYLLILYSLVRLYHYLFENKATKFIFKPIIALENIICSFILGDVIAKIRTGKICQKQEQLTTLIKNEKSQI